MAEAVKQSSGQDLLTAIVAGYELASRATEAAGGYQEHNARGWHSTGTCGSFGAAASSAKLLGLDSEHTAWAIGLSGSFTGGLWGFLVDGAMSKRLHPGKAAETGVMAAYLARRDFTGPTHIFEAEWGGFLNTYSPESNDVSLLTDRLGEEYRILNSGFKPYASCRGVHSSVDSLFKLRAAHGFSADDVERILVTAHPIPMQMVGHSTVDTMLEAQMSLPYGLSVALLTGDASLAQYSSERIASSEVREVLSKIQIVTDPTLPSTQQATVEVRTKQGQNFRERTDIALGAAENPLSDDALTDKFRILTVMVFPEVQVEQLVNTIWHIEELDRLATLWPLLARS
jgi:2-methylcitrate dehydratase PrpD